MLPEIVRAAAEPMANIKDLTVLSTDGASELVKNGTRTVAEACAVVKGVTGIDIPSLISSAIGGRGGDERRRRRLRGWLRRRRRRRQGSRSATVGTASVTGATAGRSGRCDLRARPPAARHRRRSPPGARGRPDGSGDRSRAGRQPLPPRSTPSKEDARRRRRDGGGRDGRGRRANRRPDDGRGRRRPWTAPTSRCSAPGKRPRRRSAAGRRTSSRSPTDTTVNVAAQRLARDLQAIPGIERFGRSASAELDRTGPRPLRTMWRIARSELGERYGEMTIGEVLDRYGPGDGTSGGSSATHA